MNSLNSPRSHEEARPACGSIFSGWQSARPQSRLRESGEGHCPRKVTQGKHCPRKVTQGKCYLELLIPGLDLYKTFFLRPHSLLYAQMGRYCKHPKSQSGKQNRWARMRLVPLASSRVRWWGAAGEAAGPVWGCAANVCVPAALAGRLLLLWNPDNYKHTEEVLSLKVGKQVRWPLEGASSLRRFVGWAWNWNHLEEKRIRDAILLHTHFPWTSYLTFLYHCWYLINKDVLNQHFFSVSIQSLE